MRRRALLRLQVCHRRPGKGLGLGLAQKGLDQVRQKARPQPRSLGDALKPHEPARDALSLGQGPRGQRIQQPLRRHGGSRAGKISIKATVGAIHESPG